MGYYFCLMASLPTIDLSDERPGCSLSDLREQSEVEMTDSDRKLLANYFYLRHDCINLVKLLKNPEAEIDCDGNYTREQYDDLITCAREMNLNTPEYPDFMSDFVRDYPENKEREGFYAEDEMTYQFLNYAITTCPNKLIRDWYRLNLDITNFLTAVLARQQGWNVNDYIQGDGEVQEMIRENKTKDFDLSKLYDYVKELVKIVDEADPVRKEKLIDAFKWIWLDESTFYDPFTINELFAYMCKLEMQHRWANLDVQTGEETFKQIIENLRSEAKVPPEFIIRKIQ